MFNLILILILILPFHAFLITYVNHIFSWDINSISRYLLSSWKELLIILITTVVVIKSCLNKKFPFRDFWFDWLILLLFGYSLITIAWTESSLKSIIYGLRTDFQFFLLYFAARSLSDKENKFQLAKKCLFIIGIPVAIFALAQIYFLPVDFLTNFGYSDLTFWNPNFALPAFQKIPGSDLIRAQATFGGPHQLASFLMVIAILWAGEFPIKKSPPKILLWILALVVFILALYHTHARSAWLGLAGGLCFILFQNFNPMMKKKFTRSITSLALAGIIGIFLILPSLTLEKVGGNPNSWLGQKIHAPDTKIDAILLHHISTSRRVNLLTQDLKTIISHPFGQGPGSTGIIEFRMSGDQSNLNEGWFLEVAIAYGIIGLVIYILILAWIWKYIRNDRVMSSIFIAMTIYSLFISSMSEMATAIMFWTLLGLSVDAKSRKKDHITDILGVKINCVSFKNTLEKIENFIKNKKPRYIVTVNPEFIVAAQKDKMFKKILNNADLSVADGKGLLLANPNIPERITGVDLTWALAKLSAREGYSMYLLGAGSGVAQKAASVLKKKYQGLKIWGDSGPEFSLICHSNIGRNPDIKFLSHKLKDKNDDCMKNIRSKKPNMLLVAFGTPKQEKWIATNLHNLNVQVVMGVGGTFDFIAGKQKRAPKVLQTIGAEWLWRLLREPSRLPRIWNAFIMFTWMYLFKNK